MTDVVDLPEICIYPPGQEPPGITSVGGCPGPVGPDASAGPATSGPAGASSASAPKKKKKKGCKTCNGGGDSSSSAAAAPSAAPAGPSLTDSILSGGSDFGKGFLEGALLGAGASEATSLAGKIGGILGQVAPYLDPWTAAIAMSRDVAIYASRGDYLNAVMTALPAAKGISTLRAAGRLSRLAGGSPEGTPENPWQGGKATAYRDGDNVIKEMKSETLGRTTPDGVEEPVVLSEAQRTQLANDTIEFTNDVHQAMPDIVPEFQSAGPGKIQVPYSDGLTLSDLQSNPAAYDNAVAAKESAIAKANDALGLEYGESGTLANGSSVSIDDNAANFRFNPDGSIKSWFDPVLVTPIGSAPP